MVALSGTANNQGGGGSGLQILGTEGTLILKNDLTFIPEHVNEGNGWIVESWPEKLQEANYEDPAITHEERPSTRSPRVIDRGEVYSAEGTSSIETHMQKFFDAVRNGTKTKEDATVGHHAAACAHMINQSIDTERTVHWDPEKDMLSPE